MKLLSNIQHYIKYYDEAQLFNKLKVVGKKIGSQVIYSVIIMVMLLSDSKIPIKIRLIFMAALGYLILPTDLIADMIPALGFTDDIAFLTYAISNAQEYITPEVRNRAKEKLGQWVNNKAEDAEIVDV